jgi:lysozyme family protein
MSDFERAVKLVVRVEGGLSLDREDRGNWTGGKKDVGILKGSKYGISAAQYPDEDIQSLTPERAIAIYKRDYWDTINADDFPWPLNFFMFDMAVNQAGGPEYFGKPQPAVLYAQRALDTTQDGAVGPTTKRLAKASRPWHWARFMAYRVQRYESHQQYARYGEGWLIRVFTVAMET